MSSRNTEGTRSWGDGLWHEEGRVGMGSRLFTKSDDGRVQEMQGMTKTGRVKMRADHLTDAKLASYCEKSVEE